MTAQGRTIHIDNNLLMQEITRMFGEGRQSVTIVVRGYSMRPFLEDRRDKVTLVPPRTPRRGDVVLAAIGDNRYALHRVIKAGNGTYTMRGDGNPLNMTETFHDADIIAVVQSFTRKGKTITTDSPTWRRYSFWWETLKPFRRIMLAVYRRLPRQH